MSEVSTYHMLLRVSLLTLAAMLVFDSGMLFPVTKELSQRTQSYLANAIGATASVAPNEINVITAELSKRQRELDEREAALSEREITVGLETDEPAAQTNISTYILSLLLFIILVLIILNYALDFARARRLSFVEQHGQ